MSSEKLIEAVIEQIEKDLASGEVAALAELLEYVPTKYMIGFLPEERWGEFNA
jgi:hypothetical protein